MRNLRSLAIIGGLTLNNLLCAQFLPLPATDCSLTLQSYHEVIESYRIERIRFSGCINFSGDPASEFFIKQRSGIPCALELEHNYDSESKILFWVYDNPGPLGFEDETWNTLIYDIIDEYPEEYTVLFERIFEKGRDSGSPILSHVPMRATVSITENKENGVKCWFLLNLVPVKDSDKVLLVVLRTKEKHFKYMRSIYESFIKGLYLDDAVSLDD